MMTMMIMIVSLVRYILLRCIAALIRAPIRLQGGLPSCPDNVLLVESRDSQRNIKVHVYRPASWQSNKASPVLVNLHGGGFILPAHGSDDVFCRRISQQTSYTVLDVQYRLAPEYPFPAALNDIEDVLHWVLKQPNLFDLSRLSLSGFSAGGTLALAVACSLFPPDTFHSIVAFYPTVDIFTDPGTKSAPRAGGRHVPAAMRRFFRACYVPPAFDPRDPRVSPAYADPDSFPSRILFVTAAYDPLAPEVERFAERLDESLNLRVNCLRMDGCNHAWDKMAQEGTPQGEARDKAYAAVIELLQE